MARLRQWLDLWFGFGQPVGPRTYRTHGIALFALKYGVDVLLVGLVMHRLWTPIDYLNPLLSSHIGIANRPGIANIPGGLLVTQMLWALPFLWIGAGMTMRRAVDAARSPWLCLLFLCPFVNYAVMIWLSFEPSRAPAAWPGGPLEVSAEGRMQAALQGLVASMLVCTTLVTFATLVLHRYGATVFVLTPFLLGAITAWLFNREHARPLAETIGVAVLALIVGCGAMLLFALEGVVCVAMAVPLATPTTILGAIVGRAIALQRGQRPAMAALVLFLAPGLPLTDLPRAEPPLREV